MAIIIVFIEVVILITTFLILYRLSRQIVGKIKKIPKLIQQQELIDSWHKTFNKFLIIALILLLIATIGFNSFLIYKQENIPKQTLAIINQIPQQIWINLGLGIMKSFGAEIVLSFCLKILKYSINKIKKQIKQFKILTPEEKQIEIFLSFLNTHFSNILWIAYIFLCCSFLLLPKFITEIVYTFLEIYIIVTGGLGLLKVTVIAVNTCNIFCQQYSNTNKILKFYQHIQYLIPFLKQSLEYSIYITIGILIAQKIDLPEQFAIQSSKIIKIIGVFVVSRLCITIVTGLLQEIILNQSNTTGIQKQKGLTILPLINSALKYFIYFGTGTWILDIFGIDPGPILAAAGILGIAVGLGAQNLINDMVCGILILFENYYLVGDLIETEEAVGIVESIELRTTRIRHQNGQLYIIRNGNIGTVINYSKDYIYAVVDVPIAYESNLSLVHKVVEQVGQNLQKEESDVLETTEVKGIKEFGESGLVISIVTRVKPGSHHKIQDIISKKIKDAFDHEGINFP